MSTTTPPRLDETQERRDSGTPVEGKPRGRPSGSVRRPRASQPVASRDHGHGCRPATRAAYRGLQAPALAPPLSATYTASALKVNLPVGFDELQQPEESRAAGAVKPSDRRAPTAVSRTIRASRRTVLPLPDILRPTANRPPA